MTQHSTGFAPIADARAEILILGSLPGDESIRRQQYYAHPRNLFWKIMGKLLDFDAAGAYAERAAALQDAGIAVWDVCASAQRAGSLDANIRHHQPNNFDIFFGTHPKLRLISFNGQKAFALYRRLELAMIPPVKIVVLPSTSPANASKSFELRYREWSAAIGSVVARR